LAHPYFAAFDEDEEMADTVNELVKSPEMHFGKGSATTTCESPLLTSGNPLRKQEKMVKKDSCVEFKMGKENVFTGKVDTIA
jgi:hypothetical protein